MQLTRWEPTGITSLRRQLDRLFDSFQDAPVAGDGDWLPALDEFETPGEIVVKAEIPGMDEKDISITVSGNNLMINGERKAEKEEKDKHYRRIESSYGRFQRIIPLPASVDSEKISADYRKGVLEVHLPKKPGAQAREIKVKAK